MTSRAEIDRLRRLSGVKWTWYDDDVIPAWVADMDFPTAPAVSAGLREMIDAGDLGYNFAAHEKLPAAWASWSESRYGWRPDTERVRLFSNVLQPVTAALLAATRPGDGVVLFTPIYPLFFGQIEKSGRRLQACPLDQDGWRLDGARLRSVVDDTTRVVVLCQPHNPSGRVFDMEELAEITEVAEERGLVVISDEIWQDLVYPGRRHIPYASTGESAAAHTVTITAASKSFNLGGMNCGVAHVGPQAILDHIDELAPHLLGGVSSLGARATLEAWTHGGAWLDEIVGVLESNRDHLAERLAAELPDVGFDRPEATYLAWLDLRAYDLGDDPATVLLDTARVGLSSGPDFGSPGVGFARLNFATYRDILDEIVDRLVAALG